MEWIVGCGYLGQRIALALDNTTTLTGLVRSDQSARSLAALPLHILRRDLDQPLEQNGFARMRQVYYLVPPPRSGRQDPRVGHFLAALRPPFPKRILYISTTGVYGDCQGRWVDERQPPQPTADRAIRRHDAERQLTEFSRNTGTEVVILRVAGIYGPGRLPLQRLRERIPMVSSRDAPWTNRIHIDDLVRVCIAAMRKAAAGSIYNVSDGKPEKMRDYFDRVADRAGLPRAPVIDRGQAEQSLSSGMRSYLRESRRIDNTRMLRELGIQLQYPDLRAGLENCGL